MCVVLHDISKSLGVGKQSAFRNGNEDSTRIAQPSIVSR